MNTPGAKPSKRQMLSRRGFLGVSLAGSAGLAITLAGVRVARAADPLVVAVPGNALGALVGVVGGSLVSVTVDESISPTAVRVAGSAPIEVTKRVLLKGDGAVRARYLDDARNATRVAMNLREALGSARPDLKAQFEANERAWAKPFAKKAFKWGRRLERSSVRLQRVADTHGRVYLLEWAGAVVSPDGAAPPAALAKLPEGPNAPTLAAYEAYVEKLVAALA